MSRAMLMLYLITKSDLVYFVYMSFVTFFIVFFLFSVRMYPDLMFHSLCYCVCT